MQERVESRLVQIPVAISGPAEGLRALTPEQVDVAVGDRSVTEFFLDRWCEEASGRRDGPAVPARPVAYMFFFDLLELKVQGRIRAIEIVGEVLPHFLAGDGQAMIVASGRDRVTVEPLTSDLERLRAALARLASDPAGVDTGPAFEDQRADQLRAAVQRARSEWAWDLATQSAEREYLRKVADEKGFRAGPAGLGGGGPGASANLDPHEEKEMLGMSALAAERATSRLMTEAQDLQREEMARAQVSLERLAAALAQFAAVERTKVVLYFADTLRERPGEHYYRLIHEHEAGKALLGLQIMMTELARGPNWDVRALLDRVIHEASGEAIRFYTVQAEGLTESSARVHDAQSALTTLALQTGGRAFLNGVPAARIAEGVLADVSCMLLLSFDPQGLPRDRPLPLWVTIRDPRLKARAQAHVVIRSEAARLASRLLGAALTAPSTAAGIPLSASLVPTGYEKGSFTSLVQVSLPSAGTSGGSWELGGTLISGGSLQDQFSARLDTSSAAAALAVEIEARLPPGPFVLVGLARETSTDAISSLRVEGLLPDPRDEPGVSVGPLSVLQPARGGFVRGSKSKRKGFLVLDRETPLRGDLPTAIVGLVCVAPEHRSGLQVERRLVGESEVALTGLPPLDFGKDTCIQFRDVIPERTLGPGRFLYRVEMKQGEKVLARTETDFGVGNSER